VASASRTCGELTRQPDCAGASPLDRSSPDRTDMGSLQFSQVSNLTRSVGLGFRHRPQHNERVTELTEPQVWVLIGVFSAAMFGMIGIVTTSFNRTLTAAMGGIEAKIGGVEAEIRGLRESTNTRFEAMDAKFEAMDARFTAKLEVLDKDIQALTRRAYGADQS
jgi:hypothetical protein